MSTHEGEANEEEQQAITKISYSYLANIKYRAFSVCFLHRLHSRARQFCIVMSSPPKTSSQPTKKQKTEGQFVELDDGALEKQLKAFESVQEKLDKIQEELTQESVQLESKYVNKRKPVYKERNDVIKTIPDFWKKTVSAHV